MSITQILFWVLSVVAIFSALMVISSKNPVHSVLWLIVTFFSISGHYILLNAQFVAMVQIIVYAGAIVVLFLFVVMLLAVPVTLTYQLSWRQTFSADLRLIWAFGLVRADISPDQEKSKPDKPEDAHQKPGRRGGAAAAVLS